MTTPEPTEALTRLRQLIDDGFGYDPAVRDDNGAALVSALALVSIAESLHALVTE